MAESDIYASGPEGQGGEGGFKRRKGLSFESLSWFMNYTNDV